MQEFKGSRIGITLFFIKNKKKIQTPSKPESTLTTAVGLISAKQKKLMINTIKINKAARITNM